jgi:hypothetical protein
MAGLQLLDLQPMKDRLTEASAGAFREIGFAADFAAVTAAGGVVASPSAFIIRMGAQFVEIHEGSGPLRQIVNVPVAVLVAVTLAGRKGVDGLVQLEGPCDQVRAAFFGWLHPDAQRSCWMGGEDMEDFDSKTGLLVYRLDFIVQTKITEIL